MLVRALNGAGGGGGGSTSLAVITESQFAGGGFTFNDLEVGHEYYLVMSSAGTASSLIVSAVTISGATNCTYEAVSPARWYQISSMGVGMSIYKFTPTSSTVTLSQAYNFYVLYSLLG